MMIMIGCEEAKRYEISGNDNTPPGRPIFIDSEPFPGGARVFFRPPSDEDVLLIEAAYLNALGKTVRFSASYFAGSLDVYGFGSEGEHTIEMYAVDRTGNRSASIRETVTALEPPVATMAKSVQVMPSFASMLLKWYNLWMEPLYVSVDISYIQNGTRYDHSVVLATSANQSETRSIDGLNLFNNEPVSVKVTVRDKYHNTVEAEETSIMLLSDGLLGKTGWSLPASGTMMDGVAQANGLYPERLIDGNIDFILPGNFFITEAENPWNIIINFNDRYEISRIVTHQRRSGMSGDQGALYRGDNVLAYNLYGWNDTNMKWELWSRREVKPPAVRDPSEYTTIGIGGDMAFIFPEEPQFTRPTRWFRLEALNGKYISEISLYGRKAQ